MNNNPPPPPPNAAASATTQTNKQASVPMAAQQSDGWIPMAVSRCPIDLHFVSLMAPVIAIIHLTVKGKKKEGEGVEGCDGWGVVVVTHTISFFFALPCVRQTSRPTVSGGRRHTGRRLAPPHSATLCARVFTPTSSAEGNTRGRRTPAPICPCVPHYAA